ncbi:class E basic helix-loop-helix protein 40 [Ambystoma mexicanum]|uniref:class E basic helix-loop-helix protein 40 n=1 Tax=Ambystoma mexicanum TaxID=8296 RepID=UPI0037E8DC70
MERMAVAQPSPACLAKLANPQSLEKSSPMPGMDFSHMYQLYKPRRGLKKNEDCKDSYKLPHRLIEKKRRDRINECIAQLKDLLPEHLKLTTLGHLEKAVVLELTLKHVKALTNLIEQQQQKILSLQSNGAQAVDLPPPDADSMQDIFRSGFQVCAKEVLQYLAEQDSEGNDLEPSQLVSHLQRVAADSLHGGAARPAPESSSLAPEQKEKASSLVRATEGHGKNCVPVIQRTFAHLSGEQSGSDTDTDSGYGGELEKHETSPTQQYYQKESPLAYHLQERVSHIKKESEDIPAKRPRRDTSDEEGSPFCASDMSSSHSFLGPHPHQHPLCLPFYLLPPSSTAYLPMLDKCWYPGSMPVLYPGLSASAAALSGLLGTDKGSSLLMPPRLPSPGSALSPLDSSALMQALKQIPPLNLESKD